MMLPTVFIFSFSLAIYVHLTTSWTILSGAGNHNFKPDDWDNEENKRTYDDKCVCGRDISQTFKPWSVFVFALLKDTNKRRLKHMRRCVGTLINSNMVLTSHKCLVQHLNQTINIYNAWINNFTLPLNRFFVTRNFLVQQDIFPVKDIILNTRYAYNKVKGIFPGSDIAILVLNDTNILKKMIPVCLPEYKRDLNVLYQIGYFYGVGGVLENDVTVETRTATGVPILPGPKCDEERGGAHYHLKASNESFCIRYPALAPTSPGGPLIIGVGVSETSEVNATAFLIGLSSWTYSRTEKQFNNYVYFSNILDETKHIERLANVHGSRWCRPYKDAVLDLPKKSPVPKSKRYPFENVKKSKRDESLNCGELYTLCGITNSNPPKAQSRIVGGDEANPYEFGWLVKLWSRFEGDNWGFCGGALINDLMVLTAAHCLFDNSSGGFSFETKVVVRSHDLLEDPKQIFLNVKEVFVHPAFIFAVTHEKQIFDSDIAVIILEKRIGFALGTHEGNVSGIDIRPICLPKIGQNLEVIGKEAMIAGWGLIGHFTNPNKPKPPQAEKLKKLRVQITNLTDCAKLEAGAVSDNMLCYTNYNHTGVAQGDSGGPLIIRNHGLWTVIGVVSWGSEGFDYDVLIEEVENPTGTNPVFKPQVNAYADVQKFLKFVEYYAIQNDAKWCKSHI